MNKTAKKLICAGIRKVVNKEIDSELMGGPTCPVLWLYQPKRPYKETEKCEYVDVCHIPE